MVASHKDVWVATRAQVADHWRSTFPYTPSMAQDKINLPKNVDPYKP